MSVMQEYDQENMLTQTSPPKSGVSNRMEDQFSMLDSVKMVTSSREVVVSKEDEDLASQSVLPDALDGTDNSP